MFRRTTGVLVTEHSAPLRIASELPSVDPSEPTTSHACAAGIGAGLLGCVGVGLPPQAAAAPAAARSAERMADVRVTLHILTRPAIDWPDSCLVRFGSPASSPGLPAL